MAPLVLLHGALGDAGQMSGLAAILGEQFDVNTIEFPGHGNTPGTGPFSIARLATHVRSVLDSMGIERAHFFGYSMGGYIALLLAADLPERVTSVATLGTKFQWTPDVAAKECRKLDVATIRLKVPAFAAVLEARHRGSGGWEQVVERTAALLRDLGERPVLTLPVLKRIVAPVLIMAGDRDSTVDASESEAVRKQIPTSEVRVLADTPHPMEQVSMELLGAELRAFIARQPSRKPRVSNA